MSEDLRWGSAIETRELILRGEVTAREVVEACLSRIDRLDPVLRAFVALDREGALEAADAADEALARGEAVGPLHGVPVAIKDDLWVRGMPAACGSLLFAKFRPGYDGTVAERLRAAGAIIIGKTNMPEFAAWPRSRSWVGGEAVNPWDTTRISGASSGGSGAAVASGMVPVAIGTDGGGSTRIPSALNGLVGLFPTLGRVPGYGSFCCSPTESAGPMARNVADAALIQQIIAGPDPRASHARTDPAPDVLSGLRDGVEGLRIGWSPDFGWVPVDAAVAASAKAAVGMLRSSGAEVEEIGETIPHPWGDGSWMENLHRAVADMGSPPLPEREPPELDGAEDWLGAGAAAGELMFLTPEFQSLFAANADLLTPPQQALAKGQGGTGQPSVEVLVAGFERLLQAYDVICSPTMANVAPVAPADWRSAYPDSFMGTDFTFIANSAGCPAVTVPCGLVAGLPVGLQIIGQRGDEATVLRVAQTVEECRGPLPRPAI